MIMSKHLRGQKRKVRDNMAKNQNAYYKEIMESIAKYRKQGFGIDQLEEIRQGLEHGVKASVYADKDYVAVQMRQIRFGLEEGLDVTLYNDKRYDWFQMEEIRLGLKDGVDASIYAKPQFSYEVMRELRKALEDRIHLEKYAGVGAEMLRELHLAILDHQNIIPYIKAGYVPEQLSEIRRAMKEGCKIDPYLNTAYRGAAIREIVEGMEEGLNVKTYADVEYSWQQMREIRLGLEKRLDVTVYSKKLYSWQQMREIRIGLEENLDISVYKSMVHSATDMRKIRVKMEEQQKRYASLKMSGNGPEISDDLGEFCKTLPKNAVRFFVDPDKLKAYVYVGETAERLTKERLIGGLSEHKIVKGLDKGIINQLLGGKLRGEMVVVARGKLPVRGEDGYYESFISDREHNGVIVNKDGTVDYTKAALFVKVTAGQKLLFYHEAKPGKDGYTVDGAKLRAASGREKVRIKGRGFKLLEDNKTYLAEENGCAILEDSVLKVMPLLELGDTANLMGEVSYDGAVHITGDAGGNLHVIASGDIMVDGFIENAVLESAGDILVRKGANGNGVAKLVAGKTVMGRFFENTAIQAETIIANYFFRCNLYAEKVVRVSGMGGSIAGGSVYAGFSIEAGTVGNRNGIRTDIQLGYDKDRPGIDYSGQLGEIESQLTILNNALDEYKEKYPPEERNMMPIFLKIENAVYTKQQEKSDVEKLIAQQLEERKKAKQAYIKVYNMLYEGTNVTINNVVYSADTKKCVMIKNVAGRIVVQNLQG